MVNEFIKGQGFVILELVVVLAIISLISGIIFVSLKTGKQGLVLDRAAHKVAQDLRKSAEFTLRAKSHGCGPSSNFSGYGLHFDDNNPDSYLLFADCNGNQVYQPSDFDEINPIGFEKGVEIQSINPSPNLDILFAPPNPEVFINGDAAALPAEIVLQSASDPSRTRTITVNNKGRVSID